MEEQSREQEIPQELTIAFETGRICGMREIYNQVQTIKQYTDVGISILPHIIIGVIENKILELINKKEADKC